MILSYFQHIIFIVEKMEASLLFTTILSVKKYIIISLGLLYYYKKMPIIIFAHICTLLRIINRAIAIIYKVISHFNGILTYIKVELITNLNS